MNLSNATVKTLVSIPIASALDRWILGRPNITQNLTTGLAVGTGIYASTWIEGMNIIPDISFLDDKVNNFYNSKGIISRVIEISSGATISWYVNKALFMNDNTFDKPNVIKRLLLGAGADIASTYIADFIVGDPLIAFSA
jgi:hypothetical protein